eukprot:GHVQ01025358.1.p1 GENE.GHVQ01025358.1~~GHVQ01025358.1.p1  ORF type:complete len:255 (-),score=27.87 GHVQ01025358.1:415-1179(-)
MKKALVHPSLVRFNERLLISYFELSALDAQPQWKDWRRVLRMAWLTAALVKGRRERHIKRRNVALEAQGTKSALPQKHDLKALWYKRKDPLLPENNDFSADKNLLTLDAAKENNVVPFGSNSASLEGCSADNSLQWFEQDDDDDSRAANWTSNQGLLEAQLNRKLGSFLDGVPTQDELKDLSFTQFPTLGFASCSPRKAQCEEDFDSAINEVANSSPYGEIPQEESGADRARRKRGNYRLYFKKGKLCMRQEEE